MPTPQRRPADPVSPVTSRAPIRADMQFNRARRPFARTFSTFAAVLLAIPLVVAQDPTRGIRSRDVSEKLAAIDALVRGKHEDAAKLLVRALDDRDWEVCERAAAGLAALGSAVEDRERKSAVKELAGLALDGAVVRLRAAAADAIAVIDPAEGADLLVKKINSPQTAVAACEALARVWAVADEAGSGEAAKDRIDKILQHEDRAVRTAASIAWLAGTADRAGVLDKLLDSGDQIVRAAALDLVRAAPRAADLGPLGDLFGDRLRHDDTIERRALAAAAALVGKTADAERGAVIDRLFEEASADGRRAANLASALFTAECLDRDAAISRLEAVLASGGATNGDGRAAAAKALGRIGGERAGELSAKLLDAESDGRVRRQLLDAFVATHAPDHADFGPRVIGLLNDSDGRVRERAVVWLGKRGVAGGVKALIRAVDDNDWRIGVAAIVSLGKTYDDAAVPKVLDLAGDTDWKVRGAAAVAMMHLGRASIVDKLIDLVGDPHPTVARAAHYGLIAVFDRPTAPFDEDEWREYWNANSGFVFRDRAALAEKREKYGYDVPDRDIYTGLDVMVFLSGRDGGDHIQDILEKLEIPFRTTKAREIEEVGVHPEGIFVVNCSAEIADKDVEPLQWFVHTGGSLFGSCWALQKTIERVYPGVLRKLPTRQRDVLGNVRACACDESAYLNGVFPPHCTPIYRLEGAHLIEVIDPERAEVLIDSPDAAEEFGGGNLAAWFQVGHGVIFDSANHFDLQGLGMAQNLDKPEQRQAYAIDHMGLSYDQWRELQRKAFWRKTDSAAEEVPDRSAFRFLTNFVRSKRVGGN